MKYTYFIKLFLFLTFLLCLTIEKAFAGATIPLTSDSNGHVTRVSFPAPYQYLQILDANSIVSRICIRDAQGDNVYFDGKPYIGQSIKLAPGEYCISCWSNFGNNIPNSVMIFISDGNDSMQYISSPQINSGYTLPGNYIYVYDAFYCKYPYHYYGCYGGHHGIGSYCRYGGIPYYYSNCSYQRSFYYSSFSSSCWGIRVNAVINIK